MLRIICSLTWFFSGLAFAGSWSSRGGEQLRDTGNPWFLGNTATVSFCVLVDEAQAGLTQATAGSLAKRAVDFWHLEFTKAISSTLPSFGPLGVATQKWEEHSCSGPEDESVDVRFQFGVLNQVQEQYLKTPASFAAISVRTDYDEQHLRAKGFVYLAPLSGRLAYQGARNKPQAGAAADRYYVLLQHELGHVFGLPHIGVWGLMAERIADTLDTSPKVPIYEQFFRQKDRQYRLCPQAPLLDVYVSVFGSGGTQRPCYRFVNQKDDSSSIMGMNRLSVFATRGDTDDGVLLGRADLHVVGSFPTSVFTLWFNASQQIFSAADLAVSGNSSNSVIGSSLFRVSKSGVYRSVDDATVNLIGQVFEQGDPVVRGYGTYQGEIIDLLF